MEIRPIRDADRDWVVSFLKDHWGGDIVVTRGKVHHTTQLDGLIAESDSQKVGLLTYSLAGNSCEIVSLDSVVEGQGVGSELIHAAISLAKERDCERIWLITTNDNIEALKFYQKRGFRITAVYPNAIEQARKLKPGIAMIGEHGIPIRDEIELEIPLLQEPN